MDVSLCIPFERDPSEFARYHAGVIHRENKNHRSLEISRASTRFYSRRQHLRLPMVPTMVGENEIEN